MEAVSKILIILRAVYQRRNTRGNVTDLNTDLSNFMRGSGCRLDVNTNTPEDSVLIHLFGVGLNCFLQAEGIRPIIGRNWDMTYEITLGLLQMTSRPDPRVKSILRSKFDNEFYSFLGFNTVNDHKCMAGVLILPPLGHVSTYIGTNGTSADLCMRLDNRINILEMPGFSGIVKLRSYRYVFSRVGAGSAESVRLVNGIGGDNACHIIESDNCDATFTLNNDPIAMNEWVRFSGNFTLATTHAWTGAINVEFRIMSGVTQGNDPPFVRGVMNSSVSSLSLLPVPTAGKTYATMWADFLAVTGALNSGQLTPRIAVANHDDLSDLFLLMNFLMG
nr:TPA_asm: VP6 [Aedes orbi-like virus]